MAFVFQKPFTVASCPASAGTRPTTVLCKTIVLKLATRFSIDLPGKELCGTFSLIQ
jgi:hypothetical protein